MPTYRLWLRIALLVAVLLICLPGHLVWRKFTRHSPWPRRFLAWAATAVGAQVRISGDLIRKDVFYIANHVSWIDILALGGATGCAFVSKDDVGKWPVIGWLAAQNNTILIERSRRRSIHSQVDTLREAIASHQPVALFPEGTTGNGRQLLPFKPPLLAVLLPPPRDIRIQPVHISYGSATDEIAWHGKESAGSNARRILGRKDRFTLTLHFLPAFDPGDHPDRKAIAAKAQGLIEQAMAANQA